MYTVCADDNIARHEDQSHSVGFVNDTQDTLVTHYLPSNTEDLPVSNESFVEDDFYDIATFPIFTKKPTSRRLRRNSIQIYRRSLHDAEKIASEEQCDSMLVSENMENETIASATETNCTNSIVLCDVLPTTAVENVDIESAVRTLELHSVTNSNNLVEPNMGILCSRDCDFLVERCNCMQMSAIAIRCRLSSVYRL